jgi:hypothetical protein
MSFQYSQNQEKLIDMLGADTWDSVVITFAGLNTDEFLE